MQVSAGGHCEKVHSGLAQNEFTLGIHLFTGQQLLSVGLREVDLRTETETRVGPRTSPEWGFTTTYLFIGRILAINLRANWRKVEDSSPRPFGRH